MVLHILPINNAQGVEFDTVILVGINNTTFKLKKDSATEERVKVDRDLLYVALTRAMNKLYVLGNASLRISNST